MSAATTVYARFRETALRRREADFLNVLPETADIYGIAPGEISYGAMLGRVEHWRSALASRGYGEGQRVGLLLQNRPRFVELWFALNALGVSVVPINPDLRMSELEYIVAHSEMNAAFVLAERRAEVQMAARQAGRAIPVVTDNDDVPAPFGGARPASAGDGSTECALLYTSGTTGQPKGCVLTNVYFLHSGSWYRDVGGLIELKPDGVMFGMTILLAREHPLLLADTLVHETPSPSQLAEIAVQAAAKAREFGLTPRVAFLSYANFGNPTGPDCERVRDAVALLDRRRPDFEYDGEMSPDVALDARLMRQLYPFCRLADAANILVMPDLNSANITAKLLPHLGGGTVVGPLLIGLRHPVQIVNTGATVSDLVNLGALAAHDAIG